MKSRSLSSDKFALLIHILCILIVMASAYLVRTPSCALSNIDPSIRDAYLDESGQPYLTDMDSYYHVRIVDEYIKYGHQGNAVDEDGKPWDLMSYYPKGRSAQYQPGIIWLTTAVWKVANIFKATDISRIEFSLSVYMAMISALIAYIAGCRMSGKAGGLVSGLLIGSAPFYTLRTIFGRFDTDMFVVIMNVLLILFFIEAISAKKNLMRILMVAGFVLTAILYAQCWGARNSLLFSGLTCVGGAVYIITSIILKDIRKNHIITLIATFLLTILAFIASEGIKVFSTLFSALAYTDTTSTGSDKLPNLFASIAELQKVKMFPKAFGKWFSGFAGSEQTIINGIGGMFVAVATIAGIVFLVLEAKGKKSERNSSNPDIKKDKASSKSGEKTDKNRKDKEIDGYDHLIHLCVLLTWLIVCIFITRSGVRFVEILSIPVGLFAGIFFGRFVNWIFNVKKAGNIDGIAFSLIVGAILVIPTLTGASSAAGTGVPGATDASYNSMEWIKNESKDSSIIESWWDMGYYYEAQSKVPCIWDGGSQNGARALLFSKAMTSDDLELSERIIKMIAFSGNDAIETMIKHTDTKNAFETLWDVLMMDKDEAVEALKQRCNLDENTAINVEKMIHPDNDKEIFLVITYTMTKQMGWYEYYSDWDFTGTQNLPEATWYSYTPDGTPVFLTEQGQDYLENKRSGETMWRLFFNAEENPYFMPAYEWHDGTEHVRIWRVQ